MNVCHDHPNFRLLQTAQTPCDTAEVDMVGCGHHLKQQSDSHYGVLGPIMSRPIGVDLVSHGHHFRQWSGGHDAVVELTKCQPAVAEVGWFMHGFLMTHFFFFET